MSKGTNEYVDEEDGRPYQPPERCPDRDGDDMRLRQLEEEEQQQKESKNKLKKFKIYSSELVLYETIVTAESEDEAFNNFCCGDLEDEVDRKEFQTDDIKEITDE